MRQGVRRSLAHAATRADAHPQRANAARHRQAAAGPASALRSPGPSATDRSCTAACGAAGPGATTRRSARRRGGDPERRRRWGTYTEDRPVRFAAAAARSSTVWREELGPRPQAARQPPREHTRTHSGARECFFAARRMRKSICISECTKDTTRPSCAMLLGPSTAASGARGSLHAPWGEVSSGSSENGVARGAHVRRRCHGFSPPAAASSAHSVSTKLQEVASAKSVPGAHWWRSIRRRAIGRLKVPPDMLEAQLLGPHQGAVIARGLGTSPPLVLRNLRRARPLGGRRSRPWGRWTPSATPCARHTIRGMHYTDVDPGQS